MRDSKRIFSIMRLFTDGWLQMPDMRFGQLIENLKSYIGVEDLFYIEDDIMEKKIKEYFTKHPPVTIAYAFDEVCPVCGNYSPDGAVCCLCNKEYGLSD